MGSGKTTVGKVLSEALGYSFCDWLVPHIYCVFVRGGDMIIIIIIVVVLHSDNIQIMLLVNEQ